MTAFVRTTIHVRSLRGARVPECRQAVPGTGTVCPSSSHLHDQSITDCTCGLHGFIGPIKPGNGPASSVTSASRSPLPPRRVPYPSFALAHRRPVRLNQSKLAARRVPASCMCGGPIPNSPCSPRSMSLALRDGGMSGRGKKRKIL